MFKGVPDEPLPQRIKWVMIVGGFLGWYALNYLLFLWAAPNSGMWLCALPANILLLIILAIIRGTRWIALGILAALALNFVVSLALSLNWNAVCLTPFFNPLPDFWKL